MIGEKVLAAASMAAAAAMVGNTNSGGDGTMKIVK